VIKTKKILKPFGMNSLLNTSLNESQKLHFSNRSNRHEVSRVLQQLILKQRNQKRIIA